jgi:hypothetical protein
MTKLFYNWKGPRPADAGRTGLLGVMHSVQTFAYRLTGLDTLLEQNKNFIKVRRGKLAGVLYHEL